MRSNRSRERARARYTSPASFSGKDGVPQRSVQLADPLLESLPPGPLLVLDTNVALDWVAFNDARVQPIAAAIECETLRLVSNGACLAELRRALGYAQVKLDASTQALAFARYLTHARMFDPADAVAAMDLPRCEDPDDQKFLDLAWHARASHLVTRDKALLKLARRLDQLDGFAILAPDAFLDWMAGPDHGLARS